MIVLALCCVCVGIFLLGLLIMHEQSQQRRSEAVNRLNQAIELDWRRKYDWPATPEQIEELRGSRWD